MLCPEVVIVCKSVSSTDAFFGGSSGSCVDVVYVLFLFVFIVFRRIIVFCSRSQWPRGLGHKLPSPARTLGSWVQIPLEAFMSVCVYSVFVLSCV
jgi:hypothetical protein